MLPTLDVTFQIPHGKFDADVMHLFKYPPNREVPALFPTIDFGCQTMVVAEMIFPDMRSHYVTDLSPRRQPVSKIDEKIGISRRIESADLDADLLQAIFTNNLLGQLRQCTASTIIVWGARPRRYFPKNYGLGLGSSGEIYEGRIGSQQFWLAHTQRSSYRTTSVLHCAFSIPGHLFQPIYAFNKCPHLGFIAGFRFFLRFPVVLEFMHHKFFYRCLRSLSIVIQDKIFDATCCRPLMTLREYHNVQKKGVRRAIWHRAKLVVSGYMIGPGHGLHVVRLGVNESVI